jgi:hypothetical protein
MSIIRAIRRAYQVSAARKWDRIYWCVDLHGTVFHSSYDSNNIEWIDDGVIESLVEISSYPETRIILWSSVHEDDKSVARKMFEDQGIRVDYFNDNPDADNTATGNFTEKFYFSILVDDKAGFHPDEWKSAAIATANERQLLVEALNEP